MQNAMIPYAIQRKCEFIRIQFFWRVANWLQSATCRGKIFIGRRIARLENHLSRDWLIVRGISQDSTSRTKKPQRIYRQFILCSWAYSFHDGHHQTQTSATTTKFDGPNGHHSHFHRWEIRLTWCIVKFVMWIAWFFPYIVIVMLSRHELSKPAFTTECDW